MTWPQVEEEDDMAASLMVSKAVPWLEAKGMQVKWMVVCREKHEDGELHYHMGLQTKKMVSSRDPKLFDGLMSKHGNYMKMKGTTKQCIKYLTKGDDYEAYGIDVESVMTKRKAQGDDCVDMIKEGKSLAEIWEKLPLFVLSNKRKVQECIAFDRSLKRQRIEEEWKGLDIQQLRTTEHNEAERRIAQWLDDNLMQPREFKQKQLYIWGDTNLGKTTLANTLQLYARIYSIPREEDFYDFYDDNRYDLAILDEFKASKTIQWMNEWLQGAPMVLRAKGFQIEKAQNVPTIILSNFALEDIYCHVEDNKLDTLRGRLEIVHVETFLNIDIKELQKKEESVTSDEELEVIRLAERVAEEIVEIEGDSQVSDNEVPDIPEGEWGTPGRNKERTSDREWFDTARDTGGVEDNQRERWLDDATQDMSNV